MENSKLKQEKNRKFTQKRCRDIPADVVMKSAMIQDKKKGKGEDKKKNKSLTTAV